MTEEIIAYCGLVCNECPAYIATRTGDEKKLIALAHEWYGVENDPTYCLCDGCNTDGRKNKHCANCGVRSCALVRGVVNCANCSDYGCEILTEFFQYVPAAKSTLERIRQSL